MKNLNFKYLLCITFLFIFSCDDDNGNPVASELDHNYDVQSGSISRFTYGLEFYPLNMLEIKLQTREYSGKNNGLSFKPEYLLQVHTWF